MAVIRRLNCFDAPKIKKMISYLGSDDGNKYTKALNVEAFIMLHAILPLNTNFCLNLIYSLIIKKLWD